MQHDAELHRVFFCAVDQPSFNGFSHLAIARANSLFIAVGSEGRVPSLSRRIRQELQRVFDESGLAAYVDTLARLRASLPPGERAARLNRAVDTLCLDGQLRFDPPDPPA
jgi:precorrin-2 dehydrogenase/sirohydrochlorin ferrochelatase